MINQLMKALEEIAGWRCSVFCSCGARTALHCELSKIAEAALRKVKAVRQDAPETTNGGKDD